MYTTTLTALIAIIAIVVLILCRPEVRAGGPRSGRSCRMTPRSIRQPAHTEQFPRLTRNRWARRDLARMLMTDDDYAGRITPPVGTGSDRTA